MAAKKQKKTTNKAEPEKLGFEKGKLYIFKGRYRKVYKNLNEKIYFRREHIYKDEPILFLDADLRQCTNKKCVVFDNKKAKDDFLKRNKGLIKNIHTKNTHAIFCTLRYVYYEEIEPVYSGRIFVSVHDEFGWLNINYMTSNKIKEQFQLVNTGTQKESEV